MERLCQDGAYELAGVFTEYFTLPDYQGLEVLDSGDVVISGRYEVKFC